MEAWAGWNPAAGFLHFSTKDTEFARNPKEAFEELKRRAKHHAMPLPVKRYASTKHTVLPRVALGGEFVGVLKNRRTWRKFGPAAVSLETLAQTLELTFGIQGWVNVPGVGRAAMKTSPSGGALHPMEAYVVGRRVEGLRSGIYHYDSEQRQLDWIRRGVAKKPLQKSLGHQWWFANAAFLVVMTAVVARIQWKYDDPRAYRVLLAEAGHLGQTFCLTATWLGLAPFCTMAMADTQWEEWLGIDGVRETVLYVVGAGTRPSPEGMKNAHIGRIG